MTQQEWGRLSTETVAGRSPSVLLVPLGSTEQHGPHLPLGTDTMIATAWATALARSLGPAALVAPALPYGSAGEHQSFAGTISIGRQALELVVVELVRSVRASVDAVVLVCGHAGNVEPVTAAVQQLTHEGHQVHALFPQWDGRQLGIPIDAHAGRVETSLMLHLAPELVDQGRAEPGVTAPLSDLLDDLVAGGVGAVSPTGVLGDPTGANGDEGRRLLDDLVARSTASVRAFLAARPAQS